MELVSNPPFAVQRDKSQLKQRQKAETHQVWHKNLTVCKTGCPSTKVEPKSSCSQEMKSHDQEGRYDRRVRQKVHSDPPTAAQKNVPAATRVKKLAQLHRQQALW